jgi:hypothetical protein
MTRTGTLKLLIHVVGAALTVPAAAQGLYWESLSSGGPLGENPRVAKTFAAPKKLKREDENTTIIVRLDKELMYMIRPKDKTYTEMSFADMEATLKSATDQANAQKEKLKERLKDLPPDQRAIAEKQLANNPLLKGNDSKDAKVEVAVVGEKKQLLGHSCAHYVAKQEGKEILNAWSTQEIKEFDALRKDWLDISKRMSAMNPYMGKGIGEAFEKVEGFPLETEMSGVKTTVTKIEARATPDADFEVPAGFTKTKSPLEGGGRPGLKVERKKKQE